MRQIGFLIVIGKSNYCPDISHTVHDLFTISFGACHQVEGKVYHFGAKLHISLYFFQTKMILSIYIFDRSTEIGLPLRDFFLGVSLFTVNFVFCPDFFPFLSLALQSTS
jgi:hypothetical protein